MKNVEDLVQLPLWYNKNLGNLNFPNWRKKRIVLTSDVLTEKGKMLDQKGTENRYNFYAIFSNLEDLDTG